MGDPGGKPGCIDMGGNQLAESVVAVVTLARLGGGGGVASPQYLQCVLRTPCACFDDRVKVNRDERALPATALIYENRVQLVIDGHVKYGGTTYGKPVDEVIRAERQREKHIHNLGFVVLRYSPSELLYERPRVVSEVRAALKPVRSRHSA